MVIKFVKFVAGMTSGVINQKSFVQFHFKYFIDKSIGLDNRLCLYKSSPTTRWNHLNTIYIRHRAIYPSCIHAIHLNYQA